MEEEAVVETEVKRCVNLKIFFVFLIATFINRNVKSGSSNVKKPAENKEKRRKKLNKRSRTVGPIKMKAMVHYTPTEEDIAQLLKEFTVDFLLHGNLFYIWILNFWFVLK